MPVAIRLWFVLWMIVTFCGLSGYVLYQMQALRQREAQCQCVYTSDGGVYFKVSPGKYVDHTGEQ